jgi:predicted TIM-barrel fold metal-dependent hydrolase
VSALDLTAYDAHQHVDFGAYSAGRTDATAQLRADWDVRRAMMAEAGIACSVLMPSYDYDKRLGLDSTARVVEGLVEYQSWTPGLFPWLGCTVEPQHYDGAVAQLEGILSQGRFGVVSWHNRYQGLSVDAPVMFRLVEVAAAHGCAVFVHATGNLDLEEAWRVARLVRRFPGTQFVVLDAMMNVSSMSVLGDLMKEADNVWLDTAGASSFIHLVRHLADTIGTGRLLFGSDYYGEGRGGTASLMRQQLHLCRFSDDELHQIFQANLVRVLGAPEAQGPSGR